MDPEKKAKLEAAGWMVGTNEEFQKSLQSIVTLDKCIDCGKDIVKIAVVGPNGDRCPHCDGTFTSWGITDQVNPL